MNEFLRRPIDPTSWRVMLGQVWVWDDDEEWESGQVWIPVCARCETGPLMEGLLCPACTATFDE